MIWYFSVCMCVYKLVWIWLVICLGTYLWPTHVPMNVCDFTYVNKPWHLHYFWPTSKCEIRHTWAKNIQMVSQLHKCSLSIKKSGLVIIKAIPLKLVVIECMMIQNIQSIMGVSSHLQNRNLIYGSGSVPNTLETSAKWCLEKLSQGSHLHINGGGTIRGLIHWAHDQTVERNRHLSLIEYVTLSRDEQLA